MNTNTNGNITPNNNPNSDDTFVIEPLTYVPTVGDKTGKFIDMRWDTELKKNGEPRKDLVLVVELNDETGQRYEVPQRFNMLEHGRGRAEIKKQMKSFFGNSLTPAQLAGLKKEIIVGKPVIVQYKKGRLGGVVFGAYLPVPPSQPAVA